MWGGLFIEYHTIPEWQEGQSAVESMKTHSRRSTAVCTCACAMRKYVKHVYDRERMHVGDRKHACLSKRGVVMHNFTHCVF